MRSHRGESGRRRMAGFSTNLGPLHVTSFREPIMSEAQFPRMPLLGFSMNRGKSWRAVTYPPLRFPKIPDMDKSVISEGKRVALLVEGVTTLVGLHLDALTRNNVEHKVVQAHDRVEALDYLLDRGDYTGRDTSTMPCLILLDASLPGGDGLEVLREIRIHKQTHLLPVVVFSSS